MTELGTVIPTANVIIQSRISGYLDQILFEEGQYVDKDELLARIDDKPYQALKAQYKAQLEADQSQLKQASLNNTRYQQLLKQNSVSAKIAQDQTFIVTQPAGIEHTILHDTGSSFRSCWYQTS